MRCSPASARFGASIDWLVQAGVVLKCHKIDHAWNPIAVYEDLSSFKLYMGDVGLLVMRAGMPQQTVLGGYASAFMGAVTENYVAQTLASNGYPLFYWASEHAAKLDFVIQNGVDIVGIEVKKGTTTRSRSLSVFAGKYSTAYSIRFSEKNFGTGNAVLAIPHYAAFCL